MNQTSLNRSITLTQLVLYGAGTILGAGIYVLVGEVAASSGLLSPLAFLAAAVIVAFSAYSFADLSRQFPVSAGEAAYVEAAFGQRWLSALVGFSIIFMGITSSATIARGFYGYLSLFFSVYDWIAVVVFAVVLTAIAIRGVSLTVGLAVAATVIEIAGLLLVIISAKDNLGVVLERPADFFIPDNLTDWHGIGLGAYLAFYACIGFEDMVNMAEEVKNPSRNMPLGIALVLIITTIIYVFVALAALTSLPLEELANSHAPLALVIEKNGLIPVAAIGVISAIAVTNGALIQMVMGSRVLYGMASRNLAPGIFARVSHRYRTPWIATLLVGCAVAIFAILLPMETLARFTSTIVLCVFTLINLSLLILNIRTGKIGMLPLGMPITGAILCVLFMSIQLI